MIKAFKFRVQAIVGKDTPPWFTKFEFENFFSFFYIISTQRNYIYISKTVLRNNVEIISIFSPLLFKPLSNNLPPPLIWIQK